MYILDSNILIYFLDGNENVTFIFNRYKKEKFFISIVSRLEVLIGSEKQGMSLFDTGRYLDLFENVPLDKGIVEEAVRLSIQFKHKLKFKDLIIAATANVTGSTLITADKDFQKLPGLKVKLIKLGK